MTNDDTIRFQYLPDDAQLADRIIANEHLNHANYRMIYASGWDRYLYRRLADTSILGSIAGAIVYAAGLKLMWRGGLPASDLWLFAPAPFAALASWLVMRFAGKWLSRPFHRTFAVWSIEMDRLGGETRIELSEEGARIANDLAEMKLPWRHYHYALLQPDNLLLIFYGMVVVIPNAVLPLLPKSVFDRINS